ncbi:MAG: cytochrome C [bacterium]|nr:cytochrome C [bacterium]
MRYASVMLMVLLLPAVAFAAGGHEGLVCTGCHSIHEAKADIIFALDANLEAVNPLTNSSYTGVSALCLSCHEDTGGMGILPVFGSASHPYGVAPDPRIAEVPALFLRDGTLGCVGCHDPHPSNANYQYLRVPTARGNQMQDFCNLCHVSKSGVRADPSGVFTSMDEQNPPMAAAPPAPVAEEDLAIPEG